MKYLGHGFGRVVFEHNGRALKIPYNEIGLFQNESEAEKYKQFGGCFAQCKMLDNHWLEMELLEVGELPYIVTSLLREGIFCNKYDTLTDKKIHIDCPLNCDKCQNNYRLQMTDAQIEQLKQLKKHQTEPVAQVGQDGQGNIKYYDFSAKWEYKPKMFVFCEEYLPLFEQYLSEGKFDILFCEWVRGKQLPEAQRQGQSTEEKLKRANQLKRRLKIKEKI